MFSTPDFWVFIAFLLFLAFFAKKGLKYLTQILQDHRQKIAHQLEDAAHLHNEALGLLNSYKTKHEEALEQANIIRAQAEKEAREAQRNSELEFEKFFANKEKALLQRIAIETESAKTKLRDQAAEEALAIVERVLSTHPKEIEKLTKSSLKEIAALTFKNTP